MNKKNNRKGFTIVELVIVIAVIAILATVLVPTFGNVIAKANNTALIQEIKNEHTNYVTKYADKEGYADSLYIKIVDDETVTYYEIKQGELQMKTEDDMEKPDGSPSKPATGIIFCAEHDMVTVYTPAEGTTPASWSCGCTK